ncbi:unnamed protein product [Euphydryas editha]|uniref:Uncharacterized protein n=1 Tax=Euphydryas editha TaxID=104508 RepID=A0AAU9V4X2_EUPED|nr:unnamed protein product [Euphydryas editha]
MLKGSPVLSKFITEYVNEYMYLGQLITTIKISTKEIETRIENAWKPYWSFKEIMKDPKMSAIVKGKLFNTCILPILTYGCQIWALTKAHVSKLRTCQRNMEGSMLGKRKLDKTPHANIRQNYSNPRCNA